MYIFLILLAYPIYFDQYEAVNLASLERYLSVPYLSLACILLCFIFDRLPDFSNIKLFMERFYLFFIFIFFCITLYGFNKTIAPPIAILAQKNKLEEDLLFIKDVVGVNDNIYFICQNTFNNEQLFLEVLLAPMLNFPINVGR
jgi:hypothetical protein